MKDAVLSCPACSGSGEYVKPCAICEGRGFIAYPESLKEMFALGKKYRKFIDDGNMPSAWKNQYAPMDD